MARLTISLPEDLAESAALRASAEKRSASSYVALLIERDVDSHALPPPALAEFVAKLQAAMAPLDKVGQQKLLADVLSVLAKGRRETRRKAA